jgi:WD40 repeat protein
MIIIRPHEMCVNAVAYSPDGGLLASVSDDGWVKVWNPATLQTGIPVWKAEGDTWSMSHAQFTPDGLQLFTASATRDVQRWSAQTGKLLGRIKKTQGTTGSGILVISRDGRWVAFAGAWLGEPEKIFVRALRRKDKRTLRGHDDACGALAAGPEGFASGGADRRVKLWSWEGQRCHHDLALRGVVRGLDFSPDGGRLAASGGSVVTVWEMAPPVRGKAPRPGNRRQLRGHTDQIQWLEFSPDGAMIASAAHDGTVRIWDAAGGSELRAFAPQVGELHGVAFAPDGLTLAFSSRKGHVGLLDLDD